MDLISGIDHEIMDMICAYLDTRDILCIIATCKAFGYCRALVMYAHNPDYKNNMAIEITSTDGVSIKTNLRFACTIQNLKNIRITCGHICIVGPNMYNVKGRLGDDLINKDVEKFINREFKNGKSCKIILEAVKLGKYRTINYYMFDGFRIRSAAIKDGMQFEEHSHSEIFDNLDPYISNVYMMIEDKRMGMMDVGICAMCFSIEMRKYIEFSFEAFNLFQTSCALFFTHLANKKEFDPSEFFLMDRTMMFELESTIRIKYIEACSDCNFECKSMDDNIRNGVRNVYRCLLLDIISGDMSNISKISRTLEFKYFFNTAMDCNKNPSEDILSSLERYKRIIDTI